MGKKSKLLLEIFIWIIILIGLITFGISAIQYKLNSRPTYEVIFKDIDALQVGSPVRFMGIHVGHVIKIKSLDDNVEVKFVITEKNIKIPHGAEISIQFTGLAGSKSIEILPPRKNQSSEKQFNTIEPVRITSLFQVIYSISESILESSETSLEFLGQNSAETIKKDISTTADMTKMINNKTVRINKSMKINSDKYKSKLKVSKTFVENTSGQIDPTLIFLNENITPQKMESITYTLKTFNENLSFSNEFMKNLEAKTSNLNIKVVRYKNLKNSDKNFIRIINVENNKIKDFDLINAQNKVKKIKTFSEKINGNNNENK